MSVEPVVMSSMRLEALRRYSLQESPAIAEDEKANEELRKRMFSVPADLIQAPFVVICSIWPNRMVSQPFCHNGAGLKRYTIEAGSTENPSYLLIQNAWTWILQQEGSSGITNSQVPISAASIAQDLIRYWTGDQPGNRVGKMGIGIIHGERTQDMNNPVKAKPQEISELAKLQQAILKYRVDEADSNWDNGKRDKAATQSNRQALDILGLDISQHPWYRSKVQLYNSCPNCAEKVQVDAVTCKHCDANYMKLSTEEPYLFDLAQWPGISKRLAAREQAKKLSAEKQAVKA